MRFGLIANVRKAGATEAISTFVDWGRRTGNELILCDELREVTVDSGRFAVRSAIASEVDILVSMGGDGTFLATARAVGSVGTPILGINVGSLGFLTQLQRQDLTKALEAIVSGAYEIEERMVLKAVIEGKPMLENPHALNDVVVHNGPVSRLIDINLRVNGEDLVTYRADGLILATPTGSTAYSLAVGGPIVYPRIEAIIAVPVSSFSLSTRPVIFPATDVLELNIRSEHSVAGLTLDGQVMAPLTDTDRVIVTRAGFSLKVVVFPDNSFYRVLKKKLHWGVSPSGGS